MRSASVSTTGKRLLDNEEDVDAAGSDDEGGSTPGRPDAADDSPPAETSGLGEREFTEEDPLTLKDRQSLMNVEHPFGLPIWKPALYKKSRTVTRDAETEVHSVPKATTDRHYMLGNAFWAVAFGWWLSLVIFLVAGLVWIIPFGGRDYGRLLFGLGWYIFWPFGKYVEGDAEEAQDKLGEDDNVPTPTDITERGPASLTNTLTRGHSPILESAHEGDSSSGIALTTHSTISTIMPGNLREQGPSWSNGAANERTGLFSGAPVDTYGTADTASNPKRASVSAGYWLGTIAFYLALTCILAPILLLVTMICWALVVTIPMAKLNWELLIHLFVRPLHIRFRSAPPPVLVPSPRAATSAQAESNTQYTLHRTRLSAGQAAPHPSADPYSTVLLCTYRAVGLRYYKYTVGGVNILFINLLPAVFFVIFDGFVLLPLAERREHAGQPLTGILAFLASRALIFILSLLSVIPLSYFIGMAVASISAQSSIGMGAVINATFGSIIEIILYGIALTQGKGRLVEGSIVGSLLAGVLLMPGLSMCGGALRKKEQKFNAKSAGVTSTMLIMAIIGVLTPTMFYQVYGNVSILPLRLNIHCGC
jgi:Ca2+:H+ antiporter